MKKVFILLTISLLLYACETPYQKNEWYRGGGYSEFPLGKDIVKIIFTGDTNTSKETVEKYLLYRCAEYTLSKHYTFFEILEKEMEIGEKTYHYPGKAHAKKVIKDGREHIITHYEPATTNKVIYYKGLATIKLYRQKPQNNQSNIHSAYELRKLLEPYIKRERL